MSIMKIWADTLLELTHQYTDLFSPYFIVWNLFISKPLIDNVAFFFLNEDFNVKTKMVFIPCFIALFTYKNSLQVPHLITSPRPELCMMNLPSLNQSLALSLVLLDPQSLNPVITHLCSLLRHRLDSV